MGSYLDKLLRGVKQVYHNGSPVGGGSGALEPIINFIGSVVLDDPTLSAIDVYISSTGGGSSVSGITVIESNGTPLALEPALNFAGFLAVNDPANTRNTISSALGTPVGAVTPITVSYAVQTLDRWILYDATSGTVAFTLPGPSNETSLTIGLTREFTHVAGAIGSGGIYASFNGNGAQIRDPSNWPTLASTGTVRTPGITTRIRWTGTVYECVN